MKTSPFFLLLFVVVAVNGQAGCPCHSERANKAKHREQHQYTLKEINACLSPKCIHYTRPNERSSRIVEELPSYERTNSIQDFCFIADMYKSGQESFRLNDYEALVLNDEKANSNCYKDPPQPESFSHTGGKENNWLILEHLTKLYAQSYQPFNDLPFVNDYFRSNEWMSLHENFTEDPMPKIRAPNPYFVEVTGISVNGELLQNFLHFRIFANLSVALPKAKNSRKQVLHGKVNDDGDVLEAPNYASGKISAALIMVKDQDGWPVGDFATVIPCHKSCHKYSHDVYYGQEKNAFPCSFTPPFASSHPGMFVFDVDPGRYCIKEYDHYMQHRTPKNDTNMTTTTPSTPLPVDPRTIDNRARLEGVRELHATWSFGHSTCNYVQRLYIQTLIFEDVETVYKVKLKPIWTTTTPPPTPTPAGPTTTEWVNWFPVFSLFGWSAQYNIIKTTRATLGAPDYVDLKYLRTLEKRGDAVDCHVPLWDALHPVPSAFRKYVVPAHKTMLDMAGHDEEKDVKVPSQTAFLGELTAIYTRLEEVDKKDRRYFGHITPIYPNATNTSVSNKVCRGLPHAFIITDEEKNAGINPDTPERLSKYILNDDNIGLRCPCPALATTEDPNSRTESWQTIYARNIHAQHMTVAYMLLTPIACFVVRYYKETFITLFCFQEYWWYMWHVVLLLCACMFNIGALSSIVSTKTRFLPNPNKPNLLIHYILGVISICIFYLECITGFFRSSDPQVRIRNIFTHWLIGCLNNACAVGSMFAMAFQDNSFFSCEVGGTTVFWLIFVVVCYVLMEINMRKTDKKLQFQPKRRYLPPPMKRLFTKEPPGRQFRLVMLLIFILGLCIIQAVLLYFLFKAKDQPDSCWQQIQSWTEKNGTDYDYDEDIDYGLEDY